MSTLFWILAALMALLAAALVLLPLLRPAAAADAVAGDATLERKRSALKAAREAGVLEQEEYRRKLATLTGSTAAATAPAGKTLPLLLALLLPLGAFGLYYKLGEPRALDPVLRAPDLTAGAPLARPGEAPSTPAQPAADAPAPDMEQAVAGLAERMRSTPDDLRGWMLLGRAYKTMERFAPAREALANAYRLAPDDPEVLVEYAESLALASETRRIGGESLLLIERALGIQPENQRGLWLLGISAMQAGVPADAVAVWERLLPLVEDDARASLLGQIDDARAAAGMAPRVAEPAAAPPPVATASPPAVAMDTDEPGAQARLTVDVDIDPALRARMGASDVLFVYARAAEGPRMPLAIQRLPAGSLPVRVVLDDSTSMMPTLKLSLIPQVVVGARISKSGQATPQPGDFETVSEPISNRTVTPLSLRIDRVVP